MSDFIEQHPLLVISILKIVVVLFVLLTALAYIVWFERKVVAHIQARWGPYRVGPHGLLQPLADALKFLFKEDITPAGADKLVYFLAPFISLSLALSAIAIIPFGPQELELFGHKTPFAVTDLSLGLLFLIAITSLGVYGIALAGWSSNSKYPLLGGLRSAAQMVSYELSLSMSVIGVLLVAGTFNLREMVALQQGHWMGFVPRWNIFAPPLPQLLGFFCFFAAAVAETNRVPFDLPEAESELVGGFHTEYASFKFAMFFIAEYASMVTVSFVASILFFGGWLSPFPQSALFAWTHYLPAVLFGAGALLVLSKAVSEHRGFGRALMLLLGLACAGLAVLFVQRGVIDFIQAPFWLLLKVGFFLFFYVWMRGTLPRFRYDQLMDFGWKLLLPLAVANVVVTSLVLAVIER